MPLFNFFPLWRFRSPFVWPFNAKGEDNSPHISDKIARDIKIDPTKLAQLRHQWPSESVPQAQQDHLVRYIKGR
jgi:hypothetical protein